MSELSRTLQDLMSVTHLTICVVTAMYSWMWVAATSGGAPLSLWRVRGRE